MRRTCSRSSFNCSTSRRRAHQPTSCSAIARLREWTVRWSSCSLSTSRILLKIGMSTSALYSSSIGRQSSHRQVTLRTLCCLAVICDCRLKSCTVRPKRLSRGSITRTKFVRRWLTRTSVQSKDCTSHLKSRTTTTIDVCLEYVSLPAIQCCCKVLLSTMVLSLSFTNRWLGRTGWLKDCPTSRTKLKIKQRTKQRSFSLIA